MGAINSQVNEYANAGLQRINAHISYMKEDNFMLYVPCQIVPCFNKQ